MMTSWLLVAAMAHLCTSARIRHDAKLNVLQTAPAGNASLVKTASTGCPADGWVQEDSNGFCKNQQGTEVSFICCNILRTCRSDSTELLQYYLRWTGVYETDCGIVNSDFDLTRDGQHLEFVGDEGKLCDNGLCLASRQLNQDKPLSAPHRAIDLTEMCDGKVIVSQWKPQLDSAIWPTDKVEALDDIWQHCPNREPAPTPAPVGPPPTTTSTTTVTMTFTAPVNSGVDFSFMTSDRTPEQGNRGVVHWFNKHILKRRQRNEENMEEISGGHTCRSKGTRAQTYYASSLCYWLPDINEADTQDNVGLVWNGGSEFNKPLCEATLNGAGKCMKCAVCHDNAMNDAGTVTFESFMEEVTLPSGCRKESEIETICINTFHTLQRPLKDENDRCTGVKENFERAVAVHDQAVALLQELDHAVENELPDLITVKEGMIAAEEQRKTAAKAAEENARTEITPKCQTYISLTGYTYWYAMAGNPDFYPTGEMLRDIGTLHCVHPGHGGDMTYYYACTQCKEWTDTLQTHFDDYEDAAENKQVYEGHLTQLQATLDSKRQERENWRQQEPVLRADMEAKTALWEPDRVACEGTFVTYVQEKAVSVRGCAPSYYDNSCEKACIDIRSIRPEGCGVMEGTVPMAPSGRGGLRNVCKPPQHSWIKAPWTYNATHEETIDQCQRIWGYQTPSYATDSVKSGWMLKSGRYGGWWFGLRNYVWTRRYFVLESGDQVRSGLLRYFTDDPNTNIRAEERFDKSIILWDAKGTEAVAGSHYRKNGAFCFKLKHFYREYNFCLEEGSNPEQDRTEWMSRIQAEIRFPS